MNREGRWGLHRSSKYTDRRGIGQNFEQCLHIFTSTIRSKLLQSFKWQEIAWRPIIYVFVDIHATKSTVQHSVKVDYISLLKKRKPKSKARYSMWDAKMFSDYRKHSKTPDASKEKAKQSYIKTLFLFSPISEKINSRLRSLNIER